MDKKVSVLGVEYELVYATENEKPYLSECDGYCDNTIHQCVVDKMEKRTAASKENMTDYQKKVARHELIHAFLFESGLTEESWAKNEETVDWIATQFPKLMEVFKQAEVI